MGSSGLKVFAHAVTTGAKNRTVVESSESEESGSDSESEESESEDEQSNKNGEVNWSSALIKPIIHLFLLIYAQCLFEILMMHNGGFIQNLLATLHD